MPISERQLERYRSLYLLFLDETGYSQYHPTGVYTDAKQRYLTVAGALIRGDTYFEQVEDAMAGLKQKYFGQQDVILHYTDLFLRRRGSPLPNEKRDSFWEDFLDILKGIECTLISITIDKQRMQEKYTTWRWNPYNLLLALHIERVVYSLERLEKKLHARAGDRHLQAKIYAEARAGKGNSLTGEEEGPDRQLKASYRRIYETGSKIYRTVTISDIQKRLVSKDIALRDKRKNICGLQVADLVCFPLHWNTLFELCPDQVKQLQGQIEKDRYVARFWNELQSKIAADKHGRRKGYGMKLVPG
ncbi:MAG: DUF3800 domain-containing protein [bacterium]|nr:DUF3800 domain-containing protein [bacterium]